MPENFSKDFPAAPINELPSVQDLTSGALLAQRWWDVKEAGWFGKTLGILMMRVNVHSVPSNERHVLHDQPFDIRERLDFIFTLDQYLANTYPKSAPPGDDGFFYTEIASMLGDKIHPAFDDKLLNGQKWTLFGVVAPANVSIESYAIPINAKTFITMSFEYAPNDGVSIRKLSANGANAIEDAILNTLNVNFSSASEFESIVGDKWVTHTVMDEYLDSEAEIINRLFGDQLRRLPRDELSPKLQKIIGLPAL